MGKQVERSRYCRTIGVQRHLLGHGSWAAVLILSVRLRVLVVLLQRHLVFAPLCCKRRLELGRRLPLVRGWQWRLR